MSEEVEIEFKNMLTQTEYQIFLKKYQVLESDFFTQTNIYFDTSDNKLACRKSGLRIRLVKDKAEFTLKSPAEVGLLETSDHWSLPTANRYLEEEKFPTESSVLKKLAQFHILPEELKEIGRLTTKRVEIQLPEAMLVLDESWYGTHHDYELEMEVSNFHTGAKFFQNFLQENNIPKRLTLNKIQRMKTAKD